MILTSPGEAIALMRIAAQAIGPMEMGDAR